MKITDQKILRFLQKTINITPMLIRAKTFLALKTQFLLFPPKLQISSKGLSLGLGIGLGPKKTDYSVN